jgi:hypothetical protein
VLWPSFRGYKERFIHEVIRDYRRGEYITFTVTFGGHVVVGVVAVRVNTDAVCSDSWCRESVACPWLFLSVDGRYRGFEGLLLGLLSTRPGWVRKHAIPVGEGGGLAWGKPPSLNSLRISFPKHPVYIPF